MNTMHDLHQYAWQALKDSYNENEVRFLCRILFQDLFHYTNIEIHLKKHEQLPERLVNMFLDAVKELKGGMPVQYVLQGTEFAGMHFGLNRHTLIPRPETEELVAWILESADPAGGQLLDVGTGSGCIAVALAKQLPAARVTAIDVSYEALLQAEENAHVNGVEVMFMERDILHFNRWEWPCYHVIVSNPPYVRESEREFMHERVLDYEPHRALFVPDTDPLLFYRTIAGFAAKYLYPGGWLFFEINEAFGAETVMLLESLGFQDVVLRRDLFGKDRFIGCRSGNIPYGGDNCKNKSVGT